VAGGTFNLATTALPCGTPFFAPSVDVEDPTPFPIMIDETRSVGELKQVIKQEAEHTLRAFDGHKLTLNQVKIELPDDDNDNEKLTKAVEDEMADHQGATRPRKLNPGHALSKYFKEAETRPAGTIHIIVQPPQGESTDSRAYVAVAEVPMHRYQAEGLNGRPGSLS
jgi:Crinkler effector protein N-terminal domain